MLCENDLVFDRFLAILNVFMIVIIITSNSFILIVVISNWKQILQCDNKASIFFTINLSTTDLLVAVFDIFYSLPLYWCDLLAYLNMHKIPCILTFSLIITAHQASGYTLVAIAVDRYVYVVHALRYSEMLNIRRTLGMIFGVWLAAITGTLPVYFWNEWKDAPAYNATNICSEIEIVPIIYTSAVGVTWMLLVMFIITILHWRIHREVISIRKRTEHMSGTERFRARSSRTVLVILCAYTVSWFPFMVLLMCQKYKYRVSPTVFKIVCSLIDINYLVNPIIYVYHNRPVKEAMLRMLNSYKKRMCCYSRNMVWFIDSQNSEKAESSSNNNCHESILYL